MIDSDLEKFIPKFLPEGEQDDLFSDLKQITKGDFLATYKNFYHTYGTQRELYLDQGDCIDNLPIFNLPNTTSKEGKGFILSNVCDVNTDNLRPIPMRILYAPILQLEKYKLQLKEKGGYDDEKIKAKIDIIRKQQVTNLFYIPQGDGIDYEGIVPLDHILSIPRTSLTPENIRSHRLFQLSRTAWYIFLIKITYHFARTNEELILNRSPAHNP